MAMEEAHSRAETRIPAVERDQGEPFAYLPYAPRRGDAGPERQARERGVDLSESTKRAEIVFDGSHHRLRAAAEAYRYDRQTSLQRSRSAQREED